MFIASKRNLSIIPEEPNVVISGNKIERVRTQQRSQPDDLVPLCKYLQFTDCENNQFLKK